MEVTYIRAKVSNSFSRRMKLLCNTLIEHDMLKEGKREKVDKTFKTGLYKSVFCNDTKKS